MIPWINNTERQCRFDERTQRCRVLKKKLQPGINYLFNTGQIKERERDPHYTIFTNDSALNLTYLIGWHHPWLENNNSSKWIAPVTTFNPTRGDSSFSGQYGVQTSFYILGDPSNISLSVHVFVDDRLLDIVLNDVPLVLSSTAGQAWDTPFLLTGGFVTGSNTLKFIISNDQGISGFRCEFS